MLCSLARNFTLIIVQAFINLLVKPYTSRNFDDNKNLAHEIQLITLSHPQLNERSNGVYESINENKSNGQQNNNMAKQGTPPGKEKGEKDTRETEKKNRTLSSFQNPAYQSTSMNSGLDVEHGVISPSEADDKDTPL